MGTLRRDDRRAGYIYHCLLAPVLIAGWGTGRPMGVEGTGFATLI